MKTCKLLIICVVAVLASACNSDPLYKDLPFQMEKVQAPRI